MSTSTIDRPVDSGTADAVVVRPQAGRVWRSDAPAVRRPRGSLLAMAGVAGLIAAGTVGMARLDDGPSPIGTDPVVPTPVAELPAGSMHHVVDQVRARALWKQGITGQGVSVAVIDTGVAPVGGLDAPGKIAAVVDLSVEQADPATRFVDTNGHGTHLAGIVAGRSAGFDPARSSTGQFAGVAPDAGIVSVKVAGRDGDVAIESVVTGIDWVIAHADALDIRVLNLALDVGDGEYLDDPVAAAVERAWDAGIVVVTAAGNAGGAEAGLHLPANDPYVITVAGVAATGDGIEVPEWASRGDGVRDPDLAAPGASIRSLRVPGSDADVNHPTGYVDGELFKGTGSSQAAAVVSGVVALLLDARPELTPDQVKAALTSSAASIPGDPSIVGHGLVDAAAAVDADVHGAIQTWPRAEAAGVDIQAGVSSVPADWMSSSWMSSSWMSSSWMSSSWMSSSWMSSSWMSSSWMSSSWMSSSWMSSSWMSSSWMSSSWMSSSWMSSSWMSSSWMSSSWMSSSWMSSSWMSSSWMSSSWMSSSWMSSSWMSSSWM